MDANAIINRTQALLLNPSGSWATPQYLLEFLNDVYETAFLELESINFAFNESVIELLAVPAKTVNLSTYDAANANLMQFMVQPIALEFKTLGRPVTEYNFVEKVDKLDDVGTGVSATNIVSNSQSILEWEFRGMAIFITPTSVAVDIRLRIQTLFTELVGTDSTLAINSIRSYLAKKTAALVLDAREKEVLSQKMESRAEQALALIQSNIMKSTQGQMRRIGSPARLRRRSGSGRWYPNIRGI